MPSEKLFFIFLLGVIPIALTRAQSSFQASCEEGWTLYPGLAQCYKAFDDKSWPDAQSDCHSQNAALASIHSDEQNAFLFNIAQNATDNYQQHIAWIGLNIYPNGNSWATPVYDDGSNYDYSHWPPSPSGEPDDPENQKCACIVADANPQITWWKLLYSYWSNTVCDKTLAYICQKPALQTLVQTSTLVSQTSTATSSPTTQPPTTQSSNSETSTYQSPTAPTQNSPISNCDDDWSDYSNNCYKVIAELRNFSSAQSDCSYFNANLVSIHSSKENHFVAEFFQNETDSSYKQVVIGLKWENNQLSWTDESSINFVHWVSGKEPKKGTIVHGVLNLNKTSNSTYLRWTTSTNDIEYGVFVCKKEYIQTTTISTLSTILSSTTHQLTSWTPTTQVSTTSTQGPSTESTSYGSTESTTTQKPTTSFSSTQYSTSQSTTENTTQVSTTPSTTVIPGPYCENGWESFSDYCYQATIYQATTYSDFAQARQTCQSYGADLASIHSLEENAFIVSLVNNITEAPQASKGITIGLINKENQISWTDHTPLDYINWIGGEPLYTDLVTNGALIVVADPEDNSTFGKWQTVPFDSSTDGIVCKKSGSDQPVQTETASTSQTQPFSTTPNPSTEVPTTNSGGSTVPTTQNSTTVFPSTETFASISTSTPECVESNTASLNSITPNCDTNWLGYPGGTYCYSLGSSTSAELSWSVAQAACQNFSSQLASIHSDDEQNFLNSLANGGKYWIGLFKSDETWFWTDNTCYNYQRWDESTNEPTGDGNCAEGYLEQGVSGWNDRPCDGSGSPQISQYMCKKSANA